MYLWILELGAWFQTYMYGVLITSMAVVSNPYPSIDRLAQSRLLVNQCVQQIKSNVSQVKSREQDCQSYIAGLTTVATHPDCTHDTHYVYVSCYAM